MTAPTLTTKRLHLRAHRPEDFPAYLEAMGSDRAIHMGGPFGTRDAWGHFCHDVACWALFGHGALAVETKDGTLVGQVGLNGGPLFPERELGWMAFAAHEGRGYMFEAACALRDWAWGHLGGRLVSYIDPANARSIRLAERLGAELDPKAPRPDPGDLVYLHRKDAS